MRFRKCHAAIAAALFLRLALPTPAGAASADATPTKAPAAIVRLSVDVREYGLRGTGTIVVDRLSGRYARHFNVGPASDANGYDGRGAWMADASGAAYDQGNADTRARIMWWSERLRHLDSSQARARIRVGNDTERVVFRDYRDVKGAGRIPHLISVHDQQGTRELRVTSVELLSSISATAFAAPVPKLDARISDPSGIASIPLLPERFRGHVLPLVVVLGSIDGQAPMRFLVDTGGQNIITSVAARQLHLAPIGSASVGGTGAGTERYAYAWVKELCIGAAQLRHQPFMILPLGSLLPDIGGIVGAELLSRFAVRFDYGGHRLLLARDVPHNWFANGTTSAIAFDRTMPDIAGSLAGIAGRFTLDTGSDGSVDINAPFASEHGLYARYKAAKNAQITGIGGGVSVARIRVGSVRLGNLVTSNVRATLAYGSGGVTSDPSVAGNVGEMLFRRYRSVVFDYARRLIVFQRAVTTP